MQLFHVHQNLKSSPLQDIRGEVHRQLEQIGVPPTGDIGITVGSRGIANIPTIVKAAGEWLRQHGASPFIVPAMGSHNGATAQGQQAMIESLGMTEKAMEMPIRASMECIKVGEVATGDVWMTGTATSRPACLWPTGSNSIPAFPGPFRADW